MDTMWKLQGQARQRDENAVSLDLLPLKTLHQRNKSMSALNSSIVVKGLNANPVRRTAFADISNKGKQTNALDDLGLKPKASLLEIKPLRPIQREPLASISNQQPQQGDANAIKAKSLLRPSQRPLPAATQKALPAEPVNSNVVAASSYLPDSNIELNQPRRTIVKRHTTIFRETATTAPSNPLILSDLKPLTSVAPLQPLSTLLSISQPRVTLASSNVSSQTSTLQTVEPLLLNELPALPHAAASSERLSTDPVQQSTQQCTVSGPTPAIESSIVSQNMIEPELFLPALESQIPNPVSIIHFEEPIPQQPIVEAAPLKQPVVDLVEYWDEDEEEFFDAEGCITARSIRSAGGDNTTGGVSVVLNPRTNLRVERELAAAKSWVEENVTSEDIEDEAWDTTMVAEYGDEIFAYIRDLENRMMPNAYYMENQAEIQWSMRSVLIDWVIQVHQRFALLPETLFLAVNCIDRFLSVKVVSLAKLQLVGATALYVSAKYEEINCPSVQEIAYMVDGSYTVEEILKAERFMLTMLKFEMGWPGPMSFLRRISKADDYDVETRTLAKYFLEVCLMDERFVGSLPSFLAAGSHCLARLMLHKGDWGAAHVHYSQYTYSQLRPLLSVMLECCQQPRVHHAAIYDKYSNRQYKRASVFVEGELTKGFVLPSLQRESVGNHTTSWRRK